MDWTRFHHPDLSLPVIRRKASEEWLDLLLELGDAVATRGWSTTWGSTYPSDSAYRSAMYRLRKRGLVAYRRSDGGNPVLILTPQGRAQRPRAFRPERQWDRKWNKLWYLLVYDVPEHERPYRSALRGFLRQMRLGCLQGSVWITPHDIRPEFSDLVKAGGLDDFAYLFEARTVLGLASSEIVQAAWPMDRLREFQADYCLSSEANLEKLQHAECSDDSLLELARLDLSAYLRVMQDDPLLPRSLWPPDYLGPDVLRLHRDICRQIQSRL